MTTLLEHKGYLGSANTARKTRSSTASWSSFAISSPTSSTTRRSSRPPSKRPSRITWLRLLGSSSWTTDDSPPSPSGSPRRASPAAPSRRCSPGFCERLVAAGVPLAGGLVIIDTLHPIHEGHATRWRRDTPETTLTGYGRTSEGEAAENWRRSTFYRLIETGELMLRGGSPQRRWRSFPPSPAARRGDDRRREPRQPLRRRGRHRRDGLRLLALGDGPARRFRRRRRGGAAAALAVPGAGDEVRLARPHRRDAGGDLSRPRCRAARARRPTSRAAPRRRSRRSCGSATCAATRGSPTRRRPTDHPAPQRLCRGGRSRPSRAKAATC